MAKYLDTWSRKEVTTTDKVKNLLGFAQKPGPASPSALAQAGSVSGLDPATLALGADVSHWNGKLDVAKMKAGGIKVLFPKAGDGKQMIAGGQWDLGNYVDDTLHDNIQQCYDNKIKCVPYFYFQPTLVQAGTPDADWQYKVLKKALNNMRGGVSFHGIAIDIEEGGESAPNLSKKIQQFYNWIRLDPQFNTVPTLFYTSNGYLMSYQDLMTWLSYQGANRDLWLAQWVYSNSVKTTWEELATRYIPSVNMKVITPGFATWQVVQWSAAFYGMAGCGSGRIDLNFIKDMKLFGGDVVIPDPEPEPDPEPDPGTGETPDTSALEARVATLETQVSDISANVDALLGHQHGAPIL